MVQRFTHNAVHRKMIILKYTYSSHLNVLVTTYEITIGLLGGACLLLCHRKHHNEWLVSVL